jgi:hypothetical protein
VNGQIAQKSVVVKYFEVASGNEVASLVALRSQYVELNFNM